MPHSKFFLNPWPVASLLRFAPSVGTASLRHREKPTSRKREREKTRTRTTFYLNVSIPTGGERRDSEADVEKRRGRDVAEHE